MPAGYSTNPLIKKLGIKDGYNCLILNEPNHYVDLLEEIPPNTEFTDQATPEIFDFVHVFITEEKEMENNWKLWKSSMKKTGILWVSWPKQTSTLATSLNGNFVREYGLKGGLVDVKVCAVDQDWSGIKFMYRKKDR